MFWQGYFYWFGVVMNILIVFWAVFGVIFAVKNWVVESRKEKKYAVKNVGEEG